MGTQTAIFSKQVKDFMREVPLAVRTGTTCEDVIAAMIAVKVSSATVTDAAGHPRGIITEQDITRRITFRLPPGTLVEKAMSEPVMTIGESDYLYRAIAYMRRRDIKHMPVVNGGGMLVGMVNLHDAMAVAAEGMMGRIDRLTHEGTIAGLQEVKEAQVQLAEELFGENLSAPEIQALLTHINNDIYRRIVDASLGDMLAEGWGEPPVPFTAIVMGSGGRGENYLFPDQDNGYILGDYPDTEHYRIDKFFIELAERMTRDLNHVGLPYCQGNCMAVNPIWRKTLAQWIDQINGWGRKHNFIAIRLSDIFFDFQPVWGGREMARTLRENVTGMVKSNHFFLKEMFQEEADHGVPLNIFGGFMTEKENQEYRGQLNLKHTGTFPLVAATRLLALREGILETPTLARIAALHEKGVFDPNENEELTSAFSLITGLLLKQQIKDFKAGRKVSYYVHPGTFSKHYKRQLIGSLKAIDNLRKRVRTEFTGDIF